MTPLRVDLPRSPGPDFEAALRAGLLAAVDLRVGPEACVPADCDVLVAGRPRPEDLEARPRLRAMVVPFAGLPPETRDRMRARPDVAVHNLHHNAATTAETAVALLLAAARDVVPFDRALRAGDWRPRYGGARGLLLHGREALIVGYGAIGRHVARALLGLGMTVHGLRRDPAPRPDDPEGVAIVGPEGLDALLPRVHAVVLAVPLTEATETLLDVGRLALLPDGAVVVNVARGPVVDETALHAECASGRLRAGIDTWWRYPSSEEERADCPTGTLDFGGLDTVVLSPHRAGLADRTEALRAAALADLLNALARGAEAPHRVDLERGY